MHIPPSRDACSAFKLDMWVYFVLLTGADNEGISALSDSENSCPLVKWRSDSIHEVIRSTIRWEEGCIELQLIRVPVRDLALPKAKVVFDSRK